MINNIQLTKFKIFKNWHWKTSRGTQNSEQNNSCFACPLDRGKTLQKQQFVKTGYRDDHSHIPANSHALGVRLTQSPQRKNENAWDFCPNFHNFIYTIINTSIAPKPNLTHCPTLGLAGLHSQDTSVPRNSGWKSLH